MDAKLDVLLEVSRQPERTDVGPRPEFLNLSQKVDAMAKVVAKLAKRLRRRFGTLFPP